MPDIQPILDSLNVPKSVKADAYDAYHAATSTDDLKARLDKLPLPNNAKADLWDAKNSEAAAAAPAASDDSEPKTLGGFGANLLSSAGNFLGNVGSAIAHPIDTAANAGRTLVGAFQTAERPLLTAVHAVPADMPPTEDEQAFSAFANTIKQRYGSFSNLLDTAYKDPVGFAADLSTVAGGVGAAAKGTMLGNIASKVAEVSNPALLPAKGAAALTDAATGSGAARLYQSALKPAKTNTLEDIDAMTQAGLNNGIVPGSRASLAKVQGLLADVRNTIDQGIQDRTAQGVTIDPNAVAQRVDQMRGRFQTVDPQRDLAAIDATKQRFLDQFTPPAQPAPQPSGLLGPNGQPLPAPPAPPKPTPQPIPLNQAQAMKTNTNAILSPKMGELSTAATEAQKALVRGLKEEIEGVFPEVAGLNAKQSALMGLEPAIESSIKRAQGSNLIPVGDSVRATLAKIFDDPQVKAKLAIGLQNAPEFKKYATVGARTAVISDRINQYLNGIGDAENAPQ
jgi:hypothetical protein